MREGRERPTQSYQDLRRRPRGGRGWRASVPHTPAETGRPGTSGAGPGPGSDSGKCGVQGKVRAASEVRARRQRAAAGEKSLPVVCRSLVFQCSEVLTDFMEPCHSFKVL